MQIISDDGHWAETRAVCIVRLIFSSDSRTGRLHLLLTASNSRHCIAHYVLYPVVIGVNTQLFNLDNPRISATSGYYSYTKYIRK